MAQLKTPEYILRAHRAYVRRRYASDAAFREKVKEYGQRRHARIHSDPELLCQQQAKDREKSRRWRLSRKLADLDTALEPSFIAQVSLHVGADLDPPAVLDATKVLLATQVVHGGVEAPIAVHMLAGVKRKADAVAKVALYAVLQNRIASHSAASSLMGLSVPTLRRGLAEVQQLLSYAACTTGV